MLRRESAVDPVEKSEITALLVKYRNNDQSQIITNVKWIISCRPLQKIQKISNQGKEIAFLRQQFSTLSATSEADKARIFAHIETFYSQQLNAFIAD